MRSDVRQELDARPRRDRRRAARGGGRGPGAAAVTTEDSGDVQATVRKTVRQAATATGEITNSTMYTQISAVGNGTKTVMVPVGTTSNRNLNAFGAFPMEGESMVVDLTRRRRRRHRGAHRDRCRHRPDGGLGQGHARWRGGRARGCCRGQRRARCGVHSAQHHSDDRPGDVHRRRGQGDHRGRRDGGSVRGFARRHPAAGLQRGHCTRAPPSRATARTRRSSATPSSCSPRWGRPR